jgi:hypothetical protein
MTSGRIAGAAILSLTALLAGCMDVRPSPTELDVPSPPRTVEPVLEGEIGDAVITSSAFEGTRPAREGNNLLPLAELPDGRLEGEVIHVGRGCDGDPYLADPAGAIALIERGSCLFREKILRAEAAGATGAIVYNLNGDFGETLVTMDVPGSPVELPGVFVQRSTGLLLRDGGAPVMAVIRPGGVESLEDAVQTLADAGILNHGQTTSLLKKLELAEKHIENGNLNGATALLESFISQVEELVAEGVLAPEDGAILIAAAESLIAQASS